ncbi:hypothetical protein AKJ16_DCAP24462 [Drosera capensis]
MVVASVRLGGGAREDGSDLWPRRDGPWWLFRGVWYRWNCLEKRNTIFVLDNRENN